MSTDIQTRTITLNDLKKYAMHNFKTKRPMFVWGPPGIGKSETFEQIKEAYICLLYTSPSPRDRQKCRMPSSA